MIVSPSAFSRMIDDGTESGIEIVMISVLRQLPRNSRIIRAVSAAAMMPSVATPFTAASTNTDWSPVGAMDAPSGSSSRISGSFP